MQLNEVLETIKDIPTRTGVKAWVFEIDKCYYHIAEIGGYQLPDQTSVWTASKNGKRISKQPIFTMLKKDHRKCISQFLESLTITN
jgi:hypothetical protein